MPPYLTPARFRTMDFGINTAELSDAEMMALATQATAWIDSFCLVPRLPQRHDLRGGVITGEQHSWRYPETPFDVGQRRAFPFHWPITRVNRFRIYVTNTQYVNIAPTELFINNSNQYVEVVSLAITSSGLYNALIIPNVGLATPTVTMDYEYQRFNRAVGEWLAPADGQTFRAQNQWWFSDTDHAPVIYLDGVAQTTGFSIDYDEGTVTFDSDQSAVAAVTADYWYKLATEIQFAAGHIMAYLHTEAEMHARGVAHLSSLDVGNEIKMTRLPSWARRTVADSGVDLEKMVPEAAVLLYSYRFDNVTVR